MVGPQWDNERLDLHQVVCICFHVHQIPEWIWDPTEGKTAWIFGAIYFLGLFLQSLINFSSSSLLSSPYPTWPWYMDHGTQADLSNCFCS